MKNTKVCTSCNEDKEISLFYKKKSIASGISARCKKCVLEIAKERRENPERKIIAAIRNTIITENIELKVVGKRLCSKCTKPFIISSSYYECYCVDCGRESSRKRARVKRAKNPELSNQKSKEYREKNKELVRKTAKKYKEKNKEKINSYAKEYNVKYYTENKEKANKVSKEYREKNKEKILKYQKEYRAKKKQEALEAKFML